MATDEQNNGVSIQANKLDLPTSYVALLQRRTATLQVLL